MGSVKCQVSSLARVEVGALVELEGGLLLAITSRASLPIFYLIALR